MDAIERSLFMAGAVPVRIEADDDAFVLHPGLLEIVTTLQVQAGLLALVVDANEGGTLIARIEGREVIVNPDDMRDANDTDDADGTQTCRQGCCGRSPVVARRGIFISSEMAGL